MEKVITNDGKKGGLLKGKRHYDENGNSLGGIKAVVTDAGGKPVELEGGEVIINREASKLHWKKLSEINQSAGNGVPIEKPDGVDEDPEEFKEGGKIIDFNRNHIPNRNILSYAKKIKENYPKVWDLGGNIFGNEAFKNLKRVAERGYWLDSEEWMYKKWRSFVARHQRDYRIPGVIAMLKWVDKVGKGWPYMKNLIQEEIEKKYPKATKKLKTGGNIDEKVLEERWEKKKSSISQLANNIRSLRNNVTRDLSSENEKTALTALVISIIDSTAERVGNDNSADNGHFGVTGFKKKHIKIEGNRITLKYIGKSGVEHDTSFTDEKIANYLKKAIENSPNEYVFTTSKGFEIKANKINRYLKDFNVSAKDLRGYSANKWVIEKLKNITPESKDTKRKKQFNEIVKTVADKIGHGKATLKNHYLVPELEENFVNKGTIIDIKNLGGDIMQEGGNIVLDNITQYLDNERKCYRKTYSYESSSISVDYCEKEFFKIDSISTKESKRRKGYATKLVDYVKKSAKELGFSTIQLYLPIDKRTTRPEYSLQDYKKAVSFYKKNGFEFYPNSSVKMFFDLNKMKDGGAITYKDKYNKKYGYEKSESHDLKEIAKDTGVSKKGLQEIYNKGVGAYKTNPSSVRPNVTSKEQWGMGRVYSAVMGGKAAKIDAKELKMALGGPIEHSPLNEILEKVKPYQEELTQKWINGVNEKGEIKLTDWDIEMFKFVLVMDLVKAIGSHLEKDDKIKDLNFSREQGSIVISCIVIRNDEEYKFRTEVIIAGGYNIQKLHLRYIVHTKLPSIKTNIEYEKLNEQYKKMTKAQKIQEQISYAKNAIAKYEIKLNEAKANSKLSDSEVEKLSREDKPDSWKNADLTWETMIERGADKNYDYDQNNFEESKKEYKKSLIKFWRTFNANYSQYENMIKREQKEIDKLNKKLVELGVTKMEKGGTMKNIEKADIAFGFTVHGLKNIGKENVMYHSLFDVVKDIEIAMKNAEVMFKVDPTLSRVEIEGNKSRKLYYIVTRNEDGTLDFESNENGDLVSYQVQNVILEGKQYGEKTSKEHFDFIDKFKGKDISSVVRSIYKFPTKELYEQALDYSKENKIKIASLNEQNNTIIFDDQIMEKGGELKKGIEAEKEHIDTAKKLYEHKITPKESAESIAKEHLKEDPKYYTKLETIENPKKMENLYYLSKGSCVTEKPTGFTMCIEGYTRDGVMVKKITRFENHSALPWKFEHIIEDVNKGLITFDGKDYLSDRDKALLLLEIETIKDCCKMERGGSIEKYKVAYAGSGFYGIYDSINDGPIIGKMSKEEAQKEADKKNGKMKTGGKVIDVLNKIEDKKYTTVTKNWGDIHIIPTSNNFWDEIKNSLDKSNIKYTMERYDVGTEYFKIKDEDKYKDGGNIEDSLDKKEILSNEHVKLSNKINDTYKRYEVLFNAQYDKFNKEQKEGMEKLNSLGLAYIESGKQEDKKAYEDYGKKYNLIFENHNEKLRSLSEERDSILKSLNSELSDISKKIFSKMEKGGNITFSIDNPKLDEILNEDFIDELDYEEANGDSFYSLKESDYNRFLDKAHSLGLEESIINK